MWYCCGVISSKEGDRSFVLLMFAKVMVAIKRESSSVRRYSCPSVQVDNKWYQQVLMRVSGVDSTSWYQQELMKLGCVMLTSVDSCVEGENSVEQRALVLCSA